MVVVVVAVALFLILVLVVWWWCWGVVPVVASEPTGFTGFGAGGGDGGGGAGGLRGGGWMELVSQVLGGGGGWLLRCLGRVFQGVGVWGGMVGVDFIIWVRYGNILVWC